MKFKFKNTLLVSFLAIAGILGVSSALINKQVNQEPVAEKAEAWSDCVFHGQFFGDTGDGSWKDYSTNKYSEYGHDNFRIKHVYLADGAEFGIKLEGNWFVPTPTDSEAIATFSKPGNIKVNSGKGGWFTLIITDNNGSYELRALRESTYSMTIDWTRSDHFSGTQYVYYGINDSSTGGYSIAWPGLSKSFAISTSSKVSTVVIPQDATLMILNNGNNQNQTINISNSSFSAGKTFYVWNSTITEDNKAKYVVSEYPNTGYYLSGTNNSWNPAYSSTKTWTGQSFASEGHFKFINVTAYNAATWIGYNSSKIIGNAATKVHGVDDQDIYISEAGAYKIAYNSSNGNITVSDSTDEETPTTGCYLVGDTAFVTATEKSGSAWHFNTGTIMSDTPGTGNKAAKLRFLLPASCTFTVKGFDGSKDYSTTVQSPSGITASYITKSGNNFVTNKAGYYNIYVNNSNQVYISLETITLTASAYLYKGSNHAYTKDIGETYRTIAYNISTELYTFPSGFDDDTGHNYTLVGWFSDSTFETKVTSLQLTSSGTYYVKFTDESTYTVNYQCVVDKVLNSLQTGTISGVESGTPFNNLDEPTLYGYSFEGWYEDAGCTKSLSGSYVGSNSDVFAKFSRLSSNKTYFFDISNCTSYINGTIYVHYFNSAETKLTTWPGIKASSTGITNLYSFSCPDDCDYFIINNNDDKGRVQSQTVDIDISDAGTKNLFCVNTNNASSNQEGEWFSIIYKLGGYFNATSSSQGTWTDYNMNQSTDDSGNTAELTGIKVTKYSEVKVHAIYTTVNTSGVETAHDHWYGLCQTGYTFIDYTSGKTNSVDKSPTSDDDGYHNVVFKTSYSGWDKDDKAVFSFYFKDNKIYIDADANKDDAGYLYFANSNSPSTIRITAINSDSVTIQSDVHLSSVKGVQSVSNLKFNGITGMIAIPLYNLRGNDTSKYITELQINDGSSTCTYTWAAATTGAPSIYIDISSSDQDSSTLGPQAAVAFSFAQAILNADHDSVCNITKAVAGELVGEYDDLNGNTSNFLGASIMTWTSTRPVYEGGGLASMSSILYQVSGIANDGVARGSLGMMGGFGLFGMGENNLSTIIIIVSSSIALLSVTALSILVIRKRKNKEI